MKSANIVMAFSLSNSQGCVILNPVVFLRPSVPPLKTSASLSINACISRAIDHRPCLLFLLCPPIVIVFKTARGATIVLGVCFVTPPNLKIEQTAKKMTCLTPTAPQIQLQRIQGASKNHMEFIACHVISYSLCHPSGVVAV